MKLFKIKIMGSDIYIRGVLMSFEKDNLKVEAILTSNTDEIGIFEEDKAKIYVEELNKQHDENIFVLEATNGK